MTAIKYPKFTVSGQLFDAAVARNSVSLLHQERINEPFWWEGDRWTVTSLMLSHSNCWASLYQVVPLGEWEGDTFVHGLYDEEWRERREATGTYWTGCIVSCGQDQFVLGSKVTWIREKRPRPSDEGMPG